MISGSVDIGVAPGIMGVLSAYSKGAPVRIIGAQTNGASDIYWYVPANSPIKSLKDTEGKTIAYSTNGSSTHGVVTAFMKQYDLKAKPTATGGPAPTLTQVMSGQIDVGWAAPPFGLQQLDEGKIRKIATGDDAAAFKGQTVRLLITNVQTLQNRKAVVERFMKAYRETIDCAVLGRSGGAADVRRLHRHFPGDREAHARRVLPQVGGRSRPDHRHRRDRAGCRRAQVHATPLSQGAARRAGPDPAALSGVPERGLDR